jgi:phage-related protein
MKNSYDSLNDTFNTDPVESTEIVKEQKRKEQIQKLTDDVSKDYDYTRGNLYSLIEKGQEAINGIMEVAGETASPRAYEVAGQLIKSVADTTDKLADLHKKVKEIEEDNPKTQSTVTNNALFVGSTSELSKMLKDGILNSNNSE